MKERIEQAIAESHRTPKGFGQLVRTLAELGIESYRVDYREGLTTLFPASGEPLSVPLSHASAVSADFDVSALSEAIRGAQAGNVLYPEFLERSRRAGCIGYVVWIAGRKVTYFGRRGEEHVELFP